MPLGNDLISNIEKSTDVLIDGNNVWGHYLLSEEVHIVVMPTIGKA